MSLIVKTYERMEPQFKGIKVRIVINTILYFNEYRPDPAKDFVKGITVLWFPNGVGMLVKVDIDTIEKLMSNIRN